MPRKVAPHLGIGAHPSGLFRCRRCRRDVNGTKVALGKGWANRCPSCGERYPVPAPAAVRKMRASRRARRRQLAQERAGQCRLPGVGR